MDSLAFIGWGKDKVHIYLLSGIDGVGDLPSDKISCEFTSSSFDLKVEGIPSIHSPSSTLEFKMLTSLSNQIHDLNNQNIRLRRDNLYKEIDPSKSSMKIKKNRITLNLHKKSNNETWSSLVAKSKTKSTKEKDAASDPAGGIMDMMKNLYEEGDEEMKRTIAKAWEESRTKKTSDFGAL